MELIHLLKAIGDETRIRILNVLNYGPLCVCELEEILTLTQSNVSRHLNKLMNVGIVSYYKDAKFVYYYIEKNIINQYPFIEEILETELKKINKLEQDYKSLVDFKNKGINCENIIAYKNIKNKL